MCGKGQTGFKLTGLGAEAVKEKESSVINQRSTHRHYITVTLIGTTEVVTVKKSHSKELVLRVGNMG